MAGKKFHSTAEMTRNLCITAVDGNTGFAIAELILRQADFSTKVDWLTGLAIDPEAERAQKLSRLGATIIPHVPGRLRDMTSTLKDTGCDTICLVPPVHQNKLDICVELAEAAKEAGVPNVCLLSLAGYESADLLKTPRLREFDDLEALVMRSEGGDSTATVGSPCVIRAGLDPEDPLGNASQTRQKGIHPWPISESYNSAPVALADVAHAAAYVLTGQGKHGLDDRHRGQIMDLTGPMLYARKELARAGSATLGVEMTFESISQLEAKRVPRSQTESDQSQLQHLLEYYSLVHDGKPNYISTSALQDVTGGRATEPVDFFKMYQADMKPMAKGV